MLHAFQPPDMQIFNIKCSDPSIVVDLTAKWSEKLNVNVSQLVVQKAFLLLYKIIECMHARLI